MVYPVKPLVIGAKGYIGGHFFRYFRSLFPDLIGTHHTPVSGLQELDLEDPSLEFSVSGYSYALITGGIGNPRACEEDPGLSYRCNVSGPIKLGKLLLEKGVVPVFFSSDYVFGGKQTYAQQKAELESRAMGMDALVIRLSKVYGMEKGDGTLFDEMAAALSQNQTIFAASDQFLSPIFIGDVIQGVVSLINTYQRGIVNVVGKKSASRLEMAKRAALRLGVDESLVKAVVLRDLGESFERLGCSDLECKIPSISWEEGLEKVVNQYA